MSTKNPNPNVHIPQLYASRTDVGCVREHNEDSLAVRSPLFAVADGMGGHEAGEVASAIAVETMLGLVPDSPDGDALAQAVVAANRAVLRGAEDGTGRPGMGTTMTAALVYGEQAIIAQVGDSRAYLLHGGALKRITRDHSLVADLIEQGRLTEEEARYHPQRSVITRALGSDPEMEPDIYELKVEPGDKLMLCSDGLSSMITDDSIAAIMVTNPDPNECCNALVDEAIAAGGLDNVTVIVIDPWGEPKPAESAPEGDAMPASKATAAPVPEPKPVPEPAPEPAQSSAPAKEPPAKPHPSNATAALKQSRKERSKSRRAPIIWAIVFVLIIGLACGGFYYYAQNSYYLIAQDGYVCVYRGLPGEFAGISASWLEQTTDIPTSKLAPTTASRLEKGISVDSLDAANQLVEQYRQTIGETTATDGTDADTASTDTSNASTSSSAASQSASGSGN